MTLTAFQTEADNGTDAQLKQLVRTWMPTIEAHLQLAVDTAKHMGGASPFKQYTVLRLVRSPRSLLVNSLTKDDEEVQAQ